MPKSRDNLTPDDPEDAQHLASHRGQGTGGSGLDEVTAVPIPEETDEDAP